MDLGEFLTRWTIRLALTLYVLGLSRRVNAFGRPSWLAWARLAWTGGCFAFLLHIACAFQFYHHWSHAAAYETTTRQTAEVIGLDWGGGLYANYVFALVWTADACWWWLRPKSYQARPRIVEGAAQGFLGFIAFNSTVVFGQGAIRYFGLVACLLLAVLCWYMKRRTSVSSQPNK